MTSLLRKNRRITVSPITAIRGTISLSALLGLTAFSFAQSPDRVSDSVEKKIYYSKPAEGVVPAQAIAPPAPPPIFQPLSMPVLQSQPVAPPPASNINNAQALGQLPDLSVRQQTAPQTQPPVKPIPDSLAQLDPSLKLVPPKREDVFRFDSDAVLEERIRREAPLTSEKKPQDVFFPPVSVPTYTKSLARKLPPMQVTIEPAYVMHRRLFFEQKNTERAGWDFGTAQPIISAFHFYADCILLPSRMASNMLEPYDTSAGKCLPGSPTPLLWYPPDITLFGATVGAASIYGVAAILH